MFLQKVKQCIYSKLKILIGKSSYNEGMYGEATSWDAIFAQEGRFFKEPQQDVVALAEELNQAGLHRVLDLGCGSGRHVVYLRKHGFDVIGLDNAPHGLRLTAVWLADEQLAAPLVLADAHAPLPFPDACFDTIVCIKVIHHGLRQHVLGAVKEIQRMLRPGGIVLLSVPGNRKRLVRSDEVEPHTYVARDGREKGIPHYIFTRKELLQEFNGYENVELKKFHRQYMLKARQPK
jgi:SAM-dependent methyltransferase